MVVALVTSSTFGPTEPSARTPDVTLTLDSSETTGRSLVEHAVHAQIVKLRRGDRPEGATAAALMRQQYLTDEDIRDQSKRGKVALAKDLSISRDDAVRLACLAFEKQRFRIFVDDEPILELDEPVTLRDGAAITFLRLVPLAGG